MKKYRITKQENIVYDILLNNRIHPTIKEIYELVKEKNSTIGQATVYRNVNKLVKLGKLRKLTIDSDNSRYDIDISTHSHFKCDMCKKIYDITDDIESIYECLNNKYDFNINYIDLNITGICKNCK